MVAKMSGAEHYETALEWLAEARDADGDEAARACREIALVHAQLATAAAIALSGGGESPGHPPAMRYEDLMAWRRVAGENGS